MIFKGFSIQIEPIAAICDEIEPLHRAHYAETEGYTGIPFSPDYMGFARAEKNGQFVIFVARQHDTGQIVGNLMYFVSRSTHMDSTVAVEDAFYVVPEHRGTGLAKQLLSYAEKMLAARGIGHIFMSSKKPVGGPNIGVFFESRGYRHIADVYAKRLESE